MSDRRRNVPVAESRPIDFPDEEEEEGERPQRPGSRAPGEMRKMFLKTGLIAKANGSAFVETDSIKVAAAVYGPRQTKTSTFLRIASLNADVRYAPFASQVRSGYLPDARERDLSTILQAALAPSIQLHLFPKSVIDVYVTVMEADGEVATLAAAITCASAAIADADIESLDTVTASSVMTKDGGIMLDPDGKDDRLPGTSQMMVAYLAARGELSNVLTRGNIKVDDSATGFQKVVYTCIAAATEVRHVTNGALIETAKLASHGINGIHAS